MKTIKFLLSILFLFSSVKGFSQIIEDTNICASPGSLASFTVDYPTASTYLWQVKISAVWTTITSSNAGAVYSNYSSPTLNITKSSDLPITGSLYRVIVNDGFSNLTSNEAKLIVDPIPISKTILGASQVCIGGNKTLTYGIGSVGGIQWQYSFTPNPDDFNDIPNENGLTYIATDLQETTWFRVMNTVGVCGSSYSTMVQVVVNPLPVAGNIDGGDINVCKTSNSTLLTLYNYEGNVQWQKASDVAGSPGLFSNITPANLDTYTANSLTTTTYFRALVSSGVCPSEITEPVVIIVDPVPNSKLITGASPVCEGNDKTLTYGAGSVGDILWQYSTTSSTSDFYDLDGQTERIYEATGLEETTWFRVMNSSGECEPAYSPAVQVIVNPLPSAGNIDGGDINVCKTQNSTTLTLYNYEGNVQWQKASDMAGSPGSFAAIISATSAAYVAVSLTATTYFRAIVSSGVCASETTEPVVLTVDPALVSKLITGASPACVGGSKVLVYGTGSVGDIQWQYSTTSGTAGFDDIDGETELTYLATDLQQTTWYRVMNSNETCNPVFSPVVQIVINPLPVSGFIEGGNGIVSKKSDAIELTLKDYKGTIQWQKAASLTDKYADIPSSTSSTYMATGLTDTAYFRAIVSNECAKVVSEPVFINIDSDFIVSLFPNPFDEEFNINLMPLSLDQIELKVYDLLGRIIESQHIKPSEINSKKVGSSYSPGFYNIFIKQGQQEKMIKVIKN
jgi:hypothetical protein